MLLPHQENHKFKMLGPYGNTGTPKIEKILEIASGFQDLLCVIEMKFLRITEYRIE